MGQMDGKTFNIMRDIPVAENCREKRLLQRRNIDVDGLMDGPMDGQTLFWRLEMRGRN